MRCCTKKKRFGFFDAVKARVTGKVNSVTSYERIERIKMCRRCDKLLRAMAICSSCGCFIYEKSRYKEAECPESRWKKIVDLRTEPCDVRHEAPPFDS